MLSHCRETSSSSWGCELKYLHYYKGYGSEWSSSSWGCELKCSSHSGCQILSARHPPREDVSWNTEGKTSIVNVPVILLVRMWVEIFTEEELAKVTESSSSWGCELKWWKDGRRSIWSLVILLVRMWVEIIYKKIFCRLKSVILLVRMWVEMNKDYIVNSHSASSSSWGCELKFEDDDIDIPSLGSSSSWGCELKCKSSRYGAWTYGSHPPREDVSWNSYIAGWSTDKEMSSSSWGCELKCPTHN